MTSFLTQETVEIAFQQNTETDVSFFPQFYWKIIGIYPALDPGLQHDSLTYAHCEMITNIHHLP